jgi:SSS family solute:Na+ symporter
LRRPGGDDVHRQRRPAGGLHRIDRRPAAAAAWRQTVEPGINRLFTLLTGAVVGIALVVNDVISALTLAYNLLVGGMLIPLIGAIFWKRATTPGAITSMTLGFVTALVFMFKDGLDANTPIYYSLAVALVSFVGVSLLSRRPEAVGAH